MTRRLGTIAVMLAALLAAGGTAARTPQAADANPARREFLAAMHRVESGAPDEPDPPRLRGYPLYDYLVAARLRRDLQQRPDEALDSRIDYFLSMHDGEPVARALQHDWLQSLAARARWDWFLPRSAAVSGPRLLCDRLAGRIATGDTLNLPAEAIARWLRPERPPVECAPVFAWLERRGALTVDLAELRTRAALAAGDAPLALEFSARLPQPRAAPLRLWAQLLEAPRPTLGSIAADPALEVSADAIEAGFGRLSRRDGAAAVALLPQLLARPGTTPALAAKLRLDAALGAAYDRDPDALAEFANVPAAEIDGEAAEWRVRAALWAGDYAQAVDWIEALPPALAAQPRWQYWHARAVAATSGWAAARPLYAKIADLRDFYGYLAADRLHRAYRLRARASRVDLRTQRRLAARPALVRARELFRCDMIAPAADEWTFGLAGADAAALLQAAHLAARWGWYSASIVTLKRAGEWDDLRLRYPRPFATAVAAGAKLAHLPADWLLAVMRQESLFRHDAVSPADARGLMQMQPATAAAVARRWRLRKPSPDELFEPAVAVRLGAAYLRDLLDRYEGELALGLAAYNAGPGAVARWLPDRPTDADVWIENIPYRETRDYVEHIVEHVVAYAWTRGAPPPRLARLLPRVDPAAPSGEEAKR